MKATTHLLLLNLDAVGVDTLTSQKVKGMLLNDADRISITKKDEDAYIAQRPFKGKGLKSKDQRKNESNKQNSFSGFAIPARREDILPNIVHNARTSILVISTRVKDQTIVLRKSEMIWKILMK